MDGMVRVGHVQGCLVLMWPLSIVVLLICIMNDDTMAIFPIQLPPDKFALI